MITGRQSRTAFGSGRKEAPRCDILGLGVSPGLLIAFEIASGDVGEAGIGYQLNRIRHALPQSGVLQPEAPLPPNHQHSGHHHTSPADETKVSNLTELAGPSLPINFESLHVLITYSSYGSL